MMKKYLKKHLVYLIFIISMMPACSLFRSASQKASPDVLEKSPEAQASLKSEEASSETDGLAEAEEDDEDIEYIDEEDLEIVNIIDDDEESPDESSPIESDTALDVASMPESEEDTPNTSPATFDEDQDTTPTQAFPPQSSYETSGTNISENTVSTTDVPKKWIPLKKIKTKPYKAYNMLVNSVYIARPKDTVSAISHKIFRTDQSTKLYTLNPYLKNRTLKVGDKIYYPSPDHPDREDKILFYFEDKGVPSKSYTIESGENIRKIAFQLLGHANSWKEIWATNPNLISKTQVEQEVIIKYWDTDVDKNTVASNEPATHTEAKEAEPAEEAETEEVAETNPEPEAQTYEDDEEINNLETTTTNEEPPPAPHPPDEIQEGDPYSPDTNSKKPEDGGDFLQKLQQLPITTILLALAALILCILAFIIIKKRKKKVEYDYTATNFEIDDQ